MILVLFTASYPFDVGTEQTFLNEEIKHLVESFEKVVLVPRKCNGTKLTLPYNVEVMEGYALFLRNPLKISLIPKIIASKILYRDLAVHPWILFYPGSLFRLIAFLAGAYLTEKWVTRWIEEQNIDIHECVFYTYWFDQAALGIGMVKNTYPDLKLVSRVHGYDLYEERYWPPYWPGRRNALELVDLLLADSEAGTDYLKKRYPEHASKYETARLGVADPGFINSPSTDGVIRLVSCSIISPVKRVDLLLEGVACAARQRPDQKIEWRHFGNGETRGDLQARADKEFPINAKAYFPGYSTHQVLLDYYHNNPIDLFLNVSISEGTPVSIMEVISCGIPVIATGVGGNCEIVTDQSGLLLPPNPSPQEIAEAIFLIQKEPDRKAEKRKESRALWHELYNAEENFKAFIRRIRAVLLGES